MAAGAPVIAYGVGGFCDSVRPLDGNTAHPTGLLFRPQSVAGLVAALEYFVERRLWLRLPAEGQRLWAETFSPTLFHQRMADHLERIWRRHERQRTFTAAPLPLPVPLA